MVEEGHVLPDTMVVASDSHSNMYGGLGCLGTPLVRRTPPLGDGQGVVAGAADGALRAQGSLPAGLTDLIIAVRPLPDDQVLNHAAEFCGDGVASLSVEDR